jgi:antitoxin component of RelBE/YafQ-DinJ toxin-antitoxin module
MDAKLTLSFDSNVIEKAKAFADARGISLSRLTEYLYRQITAENYISVDDFPIADWVNQVAEGEATYKRRTRKSTKDEYYNSRK